MERMIQMSELLGHTTPEFTNLVNDGDFVALCLDEQIEPSLIMDTNIRSIGINKLKYGFIALNWHLEYQFPYEVVYCMFVELKPKTQNDFDTIQTILEESQEEN